MKKLISWKPNREQLSEELCLASVSRRPKPSELSTVLERIKDASLEDAGTDLFWALLNSKEFAFNH